ncbi:4-phosphoerythronate dehydrogenase [Agitococcus lubricus]|uniref:Erythronate-4-phosphate dehydrogenase n=2 Tax=Agitococcus lubricus TaxID=1077255 RepID=A0A2T5IWA0_9GAMM|nr:4-phosphoerythronate dehydrogenase [Agitococcus lubricus]
MRIIADENMALVHHFFGHLGQLECVSGRHLHPEQVRDADILLVRSVTTVNKALLDQSRVRFVGSATIGADHLDMQWLNEQGITVSTAPGCNARSVVDYVLTALIHLANQYQFDLTQRVLGIVGLGNVGYLLAKTAQQMGLRVLGCDPLVTRTDIEQLPLNELLEQADIVSLHTPLTKTGTYPTYHLLNAQNLQNLKKQSILINTGRGAAIDNRALLDFLTHRPNYLQAVVLDVWEHEPLPNADLMPLTTIATPHIAGYSLEGKWQGTAFIYQALCQFLQREPQYRLADFLPPNRQLQSIQETGQLWPDLHQVLAQVYPIVNDDTALRQTLGLIDSERALAFDQLRKHYWQRRDLTAYDASHTLYSSKLQTMLVAMGLKTA